jgi:prolipoprotein diacylglyceryltransferase
MNGGSNKRDSRLSAPGWLAVIVLLGLLIWAVWYAIRLWTSVSGPPISTSGWVMLVLGVVLTLVVGGGLMALMFYSSRKHYDQ